MRDAKQVVYKLIQCLVLIYAVVSVIYTANYFYSHSSSLSSSPPPPTSNNNNKIIRSDDTTLTPLQQAQAQVQQQQQQQQQQQDEPHHVITWHGSQMSMQESLIMSKLFSDAMQPSHVQPYYRKAKHTYNDQQSNDITMATLVTKDRFLVLSRLATNYQGPISAAIHINDDQDKQHTLDELAHIYDSNPAMQQYVDIHLVVDTFDRQFNLWRNMAKLFARTKYIMMLDVDFHVCTNLQSLRANPQHLDQLMAGGQRALVVPAFEYVAQADGLDYKTFPTTKQQLLQEVQQGKIDMFHKSWLKGHGATDYARWYTIAATAEDATTTINATSYYTVTDYDFSYEPYIIYSKHGTPWCDERFIGYGANKAACLYEIYLAGIEYVVAPLDFLIHQTHKYPENTRRKERQYNRKLYSNFREELCLRYARLFLANGQWDTTKAENLKKECAKNRGYRTAMKSIL